MVNSVVCNFADDNTLSLADLSIKQIINSPQGDTHTANVVSQQRYVINETKCKYLILESSKSLRNKAAEIKVHNHDEQIYENSICKQACNKLNALKKNS